MPRVNIPTLQQRTNLKGRNGAAVTLTSKTVSKVPADDKAYGLGPSKGYVTYIALDTLKLEEGMTCTELDGIIRIKSVSFSNVVSDLAKNQLIASDKDVNAINKETVYLDVSRPEITTTLNQTEDVYAVVPYADNSGFYFPFEIRDDASGTNGLQPHLNGTRGKTAYTAACMIMR